MAAAFASLLPTNFLFGKSKGLTKYLLYNFHKSEAMEKFA